MNKSKVKFIKIVYLFTYGKIVLSSFATILKNIFQIYHVYGFSNLDKDNYSLSKNVRWRQEMG